MSWTKGELVNEAFGELALQSFVFSLSPNTLQQALRRLDAMMGTWNMKGIRIGYPLPSTANGSSLEDDSNLPDSATETVVLTLAMRLAATMGKTLSQDTRITAKDGYNFLLTIAAQPIQQQYPSTMPRGAGNKPWRWNSVRNFMPAPTEGLLAGQDSEIEFD